MSQADSAAILFHLTAPEGTSEDEPPLSWTHLDATHPKAATWLANHSSGLDFLTINALLAEETRPRFEEMEQGALLILRGVNLNANADPEDMISVRLWISPHQVFSLQRRSLKAVEDSRHKWEATPAAAAHVGSFISSLITHLLERMSPTLSQLEEEMDNLEEAILTSTDQQLRGQIIALRRRAIILRRYIAPQRDAISHMRNSDLPWLDTKTKRQLQESYDRFTRHVEDLDALRERSQIVQDELSSALANKLNHTLYVLSVVAAIFLPLGFLTGLLGINIGGIPGAENPHAFLQFCILLTLLVALQIWAFKRFKWL